MNKFNVIIGKVSNNLPTFINYLQLFKINKKLVTYNIESFDLLNRDKLLAQIVFWLEYVVPTTYDVFICDIKFKTLITQNTKTTSNKLTVITGPMCAGKSKYIVDNFKNNSSLFNCAANEIHSRVVGRIHARHVESFESVNLANTFNTLVFDEFHFIKTGENLHRLLDSKNIVLCGLIFNSEQQVFSTIDLWWILLHTVDIHWMNEAWCNDPNCTKTQKHLASFSRRINGGNGEFVADKELYYVSCKFD